MSYEKQNFIDGQPLTAAQLGLMEDGIIEALQQTTDAQRATNISAVRAGNQITVTTTMEGGVTHTDVITLDDSGYPSKIVTDGVECVLEWTGFEGAAETVAVLDSAVLDSAVLA